MALYIVVMVAIVAAVTGIGAYKLLTVRCPRCGALSVIESPRCRRCGNELRDVSGKPVP